MEERIERVNEKKLKEEYPHDLIEAIVKSNLQAKEGDFIYGSEDILN